MKANTPKPPQHLSPTMRRWWTVNNSLFDFEEHHQKLLLAACETWDRMQEARETIAREGAYFKDRFGQPRAHPAINVERDAKIVFARLLRELALDVSAPEEPRPPRIGG